MEDIFLAFICDLAFGDPYWFPHSVRGIGWIISEMEKFIRVHFRTALGLKAAGVVMAICVPAMVWSVTFLLLKVAYLVHPNFYRFSNILLIYTALSAKSLAQEAGKVYKTLIEGDISRARKQLSYLVSRETHSLEEEGIVRATVETVAENTVDGVLAPLLYAFLGGAPLAMAYKAINTLDSMVGYKNEKYIHLGWASARLDDMANLIPARLAGLLIPLASSFCGFNMVNSFKIVIRDRYNHTSPNAGFPESAVAGALGIQLGGESTYFGEKVVKPTIGDPVVPLKADHIKAAINIMYSVAVVMVLSGLIISHWLKY